ncbi:MAG: hypothetical protein J0I08_20755 [Rhizobiales bacterium]|nr:hypothetical protein [Hyphomicrobiales bacterium]
MQPPRSNEYSAFRSRCHDQSESDDDFFLDEIALTRNGGDDLSDDEILAEIDAIKLPTDTPENVLALGNMPENVPSRCISGLCRKMSQKGARRSTQKDRNVIEKIQKFELVPGDPRSDSLVAHQNTDSISHATPQPHVITPPVSIPDWEDVTDAVKLFSATLDIMTTPETAPYAFSFNLTPESHHQSQSVTSGRARSSETESGQGAGEGRVVASLLVLSRY